MFSDKLISLLEAFSRYELNRFRKFLLSPFFNEQNDVLVLFDLLNATLRQASDKRRSLEKSAVWTTLYPERPLDEAHLRRLASDLTQLAMKFLAAEYRSQDALSEALDLQTILEQRDLKKQLAGVDRHIQKAFDELTGQSSTFYLRQFQFHQNIFNRSARLVAKTGFADLLLPADFSLECFYLVQKLRHYLAWLFYRDMRTTSGEFFVFPDFLRYLEHEQFAAVPLISLYRSAVLCLLEPEDESHFGRLMADLEKHANQLLPEDLRECYYIGQNYCAFRINQGKVQYYKDIYLIFKAMLVKNLLMEGGQLSEGVYRNVITAGLQVGEFAWAEQFIEDYARYLPAGIRENARTFGLASLYAHQKRYEKVIELLRNVEYSDVAYALNARLILARTYYDTREWMALDSQVDSLGIFLRRNKVISKSLRTQYRNFLSFIKKLSSLPPGNSRQLESLRLEIEASNSVISKKWLLEKIEELQPRR